MGQICALLWAHAALAMFSTVTMLTMTGTVLSCGTCMPLVVAHQHQKQSITVHAHVLASQLIREYLVLAGSNRGCHVYV